MQPQKAKSKISLNHKSNMLQRMKEEVMHEADENVRDTSPMPEILPDGRFDMRLI